MEKQHAREPMISKHLDHFLVFETFFKSLVKKCRPWIDVKSGSNHNPIYLQMDLKDEKPSSLFSFNPSWLEHEDLKDMFRREWKCFDPNYG